MKHCLFVIGLSALLILGCSKKRERTNSTPQATPSAVKKAPAESAKKEAAAKAAAAKAAAAKAAAAKAAAAKAAADKAAADKVPKGTPLVDGAPPFEDVTVEKAKKTKRSKGLKYVPAAKNGDFQIFTLHSASDKKGQRSFGTRITKAFYTRNAIKDLAMVAEIVPNPKQQTKAVIMGNYIYNRAKKGKYKGSYQVVGKPNLMKGKPRFLDNPELRITKKKTVYPAEKNKYMITATPDAIQTITVHGKTYKKALRMKRTWTRVMGREVVKALEYSWWAPGVGKVADLSRFYGDGDDQTWMLWLLKDHGNSDNPHSLLKYLRKMSKKEVDEHVVKSSIINAQLAKNKAAKEAAPAPKKAVPAILGLALKKVYGVLTQFLKLAPSGKAKTTPMAWGKAGKISVKSQFYICTAKPSTSCRLKGLMLFTNAYTGVIVGGMTVSYTNTSRADAVATASTLFGVMAGTALFDKAQRWLRTQFVTRKPAMKKFGKHEVLISQSRNSKQWNIAVSLK